MRRSTYALFGLAALFFILFGAGIGVQLQQRFPDGPASVQPDYEAANAALAEYTRSRSLIDLQCGVGAGCVVEEIVLVGVGCGPKSEVMVARHEDEFPVNCEAIDAHWVRALDERGL